MSVQVFGVCPGIAGTFVFSHHSSVQLPGGPLAGYPRPNETSKLCPMRAALSILLMLPIEMESAQQGQAARCNIRPELSFGVAGWQTSPTGSSADIVSCFCRVESPVSESSWGTM